MTHDTRHATDDSQDVTARPPLSRRGEALITGSPVPEYITEHMDRSANSAPDDPNRYVGLCVAQNLLMWDVLEPRINRNREVRPESIAYDNHTGNLALRERIASFGSTHIWGRTVSPNDIVILAGAGAVLETLFYVLADPGDGILIPTPSYAFYWPDMETRDELTVVPAHTSSADGFRLTPDLLERAASQATVPISALLLTNPDNPTGRIMPSEDLAACIRWAQSRGIHVVVNGVYSLSTHGEGEMESVRSVLGVVGDNVHEIWAFSKDFAMSGLRAGVLVSTNSDVLAAVAEVSHWSVVSGDTQHLLTTMLSAEEWTVSYLDEMRSRLSRSYRATTSALDAAGIPYIEAMAGLFVLVDLRRFMDEVSWAAENELWRRILDETNVNLTPGSACHIDEPGFFRICFATEPPEVVAVAIERIGSLLTQ